jgi:hypothetical protein
MRSLWKPNPFQTFCYRYLDGLYDIRLPEECQSSGYKKMVRMLTEGVVPATKEEYLRYKNNPTIDELLSAPDDKYLTFLHENIRPIIRENWRYISKLRFE